MTPEATSLRYLSVCSGIEAASVAWHPLGWEAVAVAEIEPFPCAVLAHHYPTVPNWGDLTKFKDWPDAAVDVLVGGTPCQSFSVAGLRAGLDDPRGNLALTYLAVLDRYRPRWMVWENVPGVLSSGGGRDFGAFLGGLGQLGYGFAYRVLDAQYFGLAQRRKRVFVVGYLGDWRRAAAVLFERESLSGHPAPRREAREDVTSDIAPSIGASGRGFSRAGETRGKDPMIAMAYVPDIVPQAMSAKWSKGTSGPAGDEVANLIAHSLRADGFDASEDGTGRGTPIVPTYTLAIRGRGDSHDLEYRQDGTANAILTPNGGRGGVGVGAVAFTNTAGATNLGYGEEQAPPITTRHGDPGNVIQPGMQVRRLTPLECCRLQGFPDDYLDILYRGKPASDGPKYKALGNSMAVPVMWWIGQRIALVETVTADMEQAGV